MSLRQGTHFARHPIWNAPELLGMPLIEPIEDSIELDVMSHTHAATNPTFHPKSKYLHRTYYHARVTKGRSRRHPRASDSLNSKTPQKRLTKPAVPLRHPPQAQHLAIAHS